jgi:hypothetical protein
LVPIVSARQLRVLEALNLVVPDQKDVHVLVEHRQLLDQRAPEIECSDIAFAVAASELFDIGAVDQGPDIAWPAAFGDGVYTRSRDGSISS